MYNIEFFSDKLYLDIMHVLSRRFVNITYLFFDVTGLEPESASQAELIALTNSAIARVIGRHEIPYVLDISHTVIKPGLGQDNYRYVISKSTPT